MKNIVQKERNSMLYLTYNKTGNMNLSFIFIKGVPKMINVQANSFIRRYGRKWYSSEYINTSWNSIMFYISKMKYLNGKGNTTTENKLKEISLFVHKRFMVIALKYKN